MCLVTVYSCLLVLPLTVMEFLVCSMAANILLWTLSVLHVVVVMSIVLRAFLCISPAANVNIIIISTFKNTTAKYYYSRSLHRCVYMLLGHTSPRSRASRHAFPQKHVAKAYKHIDMVKDMISCINDKKNK